MPTGIRNQDLRVTTGFVDTVADDFPGGGSSSPGLAPGQPGCKVTLGVNANAINNSLNRYEGTVQYVKTLSTDTTVPLLGLQAFWADRGQYFVSTDGTTYGIENLAGIYLGSLPPGKWGFIKTLDGGRTLVNFSGGAPAAYLQAVAQTTAIATTAAATTDIKGYYIGICQGGKVSGECAVVALKNQQS